MKSHIVRLSALPDVTSNNVWIKSKFHEIWQGCHDIEGNLDAIFYKPIKNLQQFHNTPSLLVVYLTAIFSN
jgi:hypothetical protein